MYRHNIYHLNLVTNLPIHSHVNTYYTDAWQFEAAVAGHLVVLDGLQRLAPGNLYAALGGTSFDSQLDAVNCWNPLEIPLKS